MLINYTILWVYYTISNLDVLDIYCLEGLTFSFSYILDACLCSDCFVRSPSKALEKAALIEVHIMYMDGRLEVISWNIETQCNVAINRVIF